jgi:putative ABC transport system permease protein
MTRVLLRKTLRDMRASRAQIIALIVIVTLGVSSFVALIGAYRDLSISYNHTYQQLGLADVDYSIQPTTSDVVGQVAKMEGVAAVTGRLIVDTGMDLPPGAAGVKDEKIRARLIGIMPDRHPEVDDILVLKGRYLDPRDTKVALLESHFAEVYHLAPGDSLVPTVNGNKESLQVVGIAASPEYLIVSASRQDVIPSARTFAVLFVPQPELQHLIGAGDVVNDIAVRIAPGADHAAVVEAIKGKLNPYGLLSTTLQKDQPSSAALKLDLDGYQEIGYLMPVLILLVAAASLYVTLGRLIRSQQTQIGLMRALGYQRSAVVGHYLALALIIGALGSLLGIVLGMPLGQEITTEYAGELGIPLVQSRFYADLAVEGALLSLAMTVLAGVVPAFSASRLAPVAAMRPVPSETLVKGGQSFVEHVVRLPVWLRLSLRNVFRVRSRAISTGLGIVFSFILLLSSWAFMDSFQYATQQTFNSTEQWDLFAVFAQPRARSSLRRIESWPGVQKVQPLIQFPATLKGSGQQEEIAVTALEPSGSLHRLTFMSGTDPVQALAEGRIVLTSALADKFNLKVGDRVTVETPSNSGKDKKTTRTLILGGTVDEMMSAVGYISLDEGQRWQNTSELLFDGVYVKADPSRANEIKSDLYHYMDASSVQLKSAVEGDWQSLMGFFYAFIGMLVVFAAAMAFALLFNAMTVNVLEQQREFATMRAIGTSGGSIALLLTMENVMLWLFTLIPGLVLGTLVANQMGAAFGSDFLTFKIVIAPLTYVIAALGILVTMVLAALPAIRHVNRLNLADSTKVLT